MTGNELYEEYCKEYPLMMGYREVSYESWLQRQVLELRENVVNKNCNIPLPLSREMDERLRFLNRKEFHNCCSNPSCTGYEGTEEESKCPKCKSIYIKQFNEGGNKMNIKGINYNWFATPENGEEFSSWFIGMNYRNDISVIKIKEHRAEGEGDKWYYDVFLSDGTMERIFNPNVVVFDNEEETK